ncbi:MAG: diguanylate cyclase [Rhodocyclales bacterium]|nr:diguanylate cyclase [Rhodocyclales bacterium]
MSPIDISKFQQLKASGNLPSPKGVALAILRLTQKEDASMAELARIVKSDPAFVGRLIKAANSVNVNPGRPIVSVQDALLVLGMPAVRSLALSFSLLSQYKQGACDGFDYQRFWSGALACALGLQALTLRIHAARAEESFSIGLLARIGELALATMFPEQYSRVLSEAGGDRGARLIELEQGRFAMNHRELTAAMLADWGLPKIFSDPVFHHEEPDYAGFAQGGRESALLLSLALSRAIAEVCLAADEGRAQHLPCLFALGSRLSIEEEELTLLCDGVVRQWREWAATLNVVSQPLPSFEELAKVQPAPAAAAGETPDSATSLRVLVVEGEAAVRGTLRAVLEREGYQVFEAADGQEGLRAALDYQPHMMVVDCMIPDMDGLALTRSLRETRLGRGVYILVMTGVVDEAKLVAAFESGVDDYIAKPVSLPLLGARLRAGQRVVRMQQEIERDREDIRRFAAELAISNRRLQEAALTDALTGFPNRRYAMERLQQEWSATTRSNRPLACMVIDLDQFKQVNDTYGHDVGDTYLKQTAQAVRKGLRVQDVVCRTGGDEFLVICPDTDLPAALVCAERMRHSVESTPVKAGLLQLKATMSVGVAVREPAMTDAETLIKRADQGVYLAKQRGRNRVASTQATS